LQKEKAVCRKDLLFKWFKNSWLMVFFAERKHLFQKNFAEKAWGVML